MRPTIAPPCGDATWSRCSGLHALPACRSLGGPHIAGSVAASDPVAGVTRLLEASGITASARRNPAAAVAGSERRSASWQSGNLGCSRAFADSPGCQDSSFSVPRPGGDLGGRDRAGLQGGRRSGELETRNAGNPRGAAWGGSTRARWCSGVPAWGVTRAAAVASPMARRRASLAARGMRGGCGCARVPRASTLRTKAANRERVRSERSAGPARAGASHFPRVRVFARRSTSVPVTKSFLVFDR